MKTLTRNSALNDSLAANPANLQNALVHTMLSAAQLATEWLMERNVTIISVTLHGKPVITVMPGAELSSLTHTGGWKLHCYKDASGKHIHQYFMELRGCLITWATYNLHVTHASEASHATH